MARNADTERKEFIAQVGRRLAEARAQTGLSQREVARLMQRSPAWVSQVETGNYSADPFELVQLADLYGVDIAQVLGFEDFRKTRTPESLADWLLLMKNEDEAQIHFRLQRMLKASAARAAEEPEPYDTTGQPSSTGRRGRRRGTTETDHAVRTSAEDLSASGA